MTMTSSTTNKSAGTLQKLVASINRRNNGPDLSNLMCFFGEDLFIWNSDEQCLYLCSLNELHQITDIRVITLTNPPLFDVSTLILNPHGDYLALSGEGGLMVIELPPNGSLRQVDSNGLSGQLLVRSTSIGERLFLCSKHLKLLCARWHPASRQHLVILSNDNCLRLFDIENEYEPLKTIHLNSKNAADLHFERVSIFSSSLGESAVAFDYGPSLARYHHQDDATELLDVYPFFILKGNGDVLLLYMSLKELHIADQIYGPLKMTPAAEDNYGSDACSLLCLDCVPLLVVIGTSSGLLYHCVAIEGELAEERELDSSLQETHLFNLCSGTTVVIPEPVLYVLETIELSFPLTSTELNSELYNGNELNSSLKLIADSLDAKRYFCLHSFGIHIVMVSFCKQLASDCVDFHDDKSVVEYLICTKPTVEKCGADDERTQQNESFPVGLSLFLTRGFTYIAVLLNSAELICKRLSNVLLPDSLFDLLSQKSKDLDLGFLSTSSKKSLSNNSPYKEDSVLPHKSNFPEHLEKILQKNTSLPLIKSSKAKNSPVSAQDLEMLLNSIDVLKSEYLAKFALAAKAIEIRKKSLKNICQFQLTELDKLFADKEAILNDYVKLVDKYDQVKEYQSELTTRLGRSIGYMQSQRPTLSDAEIELNKQLIKEQKNITMYKQKLEQIKCKHRYQEAQARKLMITDECSEKIKLQSTLNSQLHIKEILAQQGEEISQLVSQVNLLKVNP